MKQQYSITVLKRKIAGWMMMWYWSSVRVYGCGPAGCWVWLHVSHQHVPICVQSRPWAWCGNHHRPCVQPQPAAPDHRQIQIIMFSPGGRHYFDRLCSDRRYSDNPQSGRPSTSLVSSGICRNSRNLEKIRGVKVSHASKARHWLRHQGDRGERGLGRVSRWGLGCPLLRKSYNLPPRPQHVYCPWFSRFGWMSFQSVLPIGLSSCSQPPAVPKCELSE